MGISPARAAIVLVLFAIAAFSLVDVGTRPSVSGEAAAVPTTTTTPHAATHNSTPTTTTTTVPHSSVRVVVANATQTNQLAEHYTAVLAPYGWAMQTPVDGTTTEATSVVYYAAGQQEPAAQIATTLGINATEVLPLSASVPVATTTGDDVVVVIGSDLVPKAGT